MNVRARFIVAIVAVVMVNALFFVLFVRGRQSDLAGIKDEIALEENQTQSLQADLDRLQGLRDQASNFEAQLLEIRQLVPQRHEVPNLIFQIEEAADQAGVDFIQIGPELPKPPPEDATLAEVRLNITANGGFFSLQDFIRRLYALDRALRVDVMTMGGQEGTEEGGGTTDITLNITARVFFEQPAGSTVTPPGAPPPAPEEPAEETPAPEGSPAEGSPAPEESL